MVPHAGTASNHTFQALYYYLHHYRPHILCTESIYIGYSQKKQVRNGQNSELTVSDSERTSCGAALG